MRRKGQLFHLAGGWGTHVVQEQEGSLYLKLAQKGGQQSEVKRALNVMCHAQVFGLYSVGSHGKILLVGKKGHGVTGEAVLAPPKVSISKLSSILRCRQDFSPKQRRGLCALRFRWSVLIPVFFKQMLHKPKYMGTPGPHPSLPSLPRAPQ